MKTATSRPTGRGEKLREFFCGFFYKLICHLGKFTEKSTEKFTPAVRTIHGEIRQEIHQKIHQKIHWEIHTNLHKETHWIIELDVLLSMKVTYAAWHRSIALLAGVCTVLGPSAIKLLHNTLSETMLRAALLPACGAMTSTEKTRCLQDFPTRQCRE